MPTRLEFLGDQGILARCDSEAEALRWAAAVRRLAPAWMLDLVGAYTSVAVFHDQARIRLVEALAELDGLVADSGIDAVGQQHRIPCCYELGPDLEHIAEVVGLGVEEVIELHTSMEYTIYAIGFCPGFPYLGYLPEALAGLPRLPAPRLRVEPGSVGLTGRQTGIYTEPRPGGWNLIGRTPLALVDVAVGYFPLATGDRVRFERIDRGEFERRLGERFGGS